MPLRVVIPPRPSAVFGEGTGQKGSLSLIDQRQGQKSKVTPEVLAGLAPELTVITAEAGWGLRPVSIGAFAKPGWPRGFCVTRRQTASRIRGDLSNYLQLTDFGLLLKCFYFVQELLLEPIHGGCPQTYFLIVPYRAWMVRDHYVISYSILLIPVLQGPVHAL